MVIMCGQKTMRPSFRGVLPESAPVNAVLFFPRSRGPVAVKRNSLCSSVVVTACTKTLPGSYIISSTPVPGNNMRGCALPAQIFGVPGFSPSPPSNVSGGMRAIFPFRSMPLMSIAPPDATVNSRLHFSPAHSLIQMWKMAVDYARMNFALFSGKF